MSRVTERLRLAIGVAASAVLMSGCGVEGPKVVATFCGDTGLEPAFLGEGPPGIGDFYSYEDATGWLIYDDGQVVRMETTVVDENGVESRRVVMCNDIGRN